MNRNLIIGSGAVLPSGVTQDAVVLGSVNSTVYLGGGAVQASATALKIATPLYAGGATGSAGQILKSTGAGIEWATAGGAPAAALTFTGVTQVTSANSVYVFGSAALEAAILTLPAVSTLVGVPLSIKNQSLYVLTVNAPATTLVAPATTAVITTAPIASGGSCQIVSDGTNWLMLNAAGAPPTTPIAPATVAITNPASGVAPSTLTVTYSVPTNTTSFLVQIAQIVGGSPVYVGASSVAASGTPMAVAVPAAAGTYATASTNLFRAYVTPFNGWAPGPFSNSSPDSDFSKPTNVAIATPVGGNSPVGLTVTWTAPAFAPDSYTVEIFANTDLLGTVSALGTATSATVPNVDVRTANPITARVTVTQGSFSSNASSTGYTWTTPRSLMPNITDMETAVLNPTGIVTGSWALAEYGAANYGSVAVNLYNISRYLLTPNPVETRILSASSTSFTSSSRQPLTYNDGNADVPYVYYFELTYYNPTWGGYSATAKSPGIYWDNGVPGQVLTIVNWPWP